MKHPYEYAIMVDYLSPAQLGFPPDFNKEPAQVGLMKGLQKLVKGLPQMITQLPPGEGWQVNSHSLTLAGTTLIISILLQRS